MPKAYFKRVKTNQNNNYYFEEKTVNICCMPDAKKVD